MAAHAVRPREWLVHSETYSGEYTALLDYSTDEADHRYDDDERSEDDEEDGWSSEQSGLVGDHEINQLQHTLVDEKPDSDAQNS